MVLCDETNLSEVFASLFQSYFCNKHPIQILIATGTDSLCTARLLALLLNSEGIKFSMTPVESYESVILWAKDTLWPGMQVGEITSVVLINCGATINIIREIVVGSREHEYHQMVKDEERQSGEEVLPERKEELFIQFRDGLDIPEAGDLRFYVFDYHRPFNVNNVWHNDYVWLVQSPKDSRITRMKDVPLPLEYDDDDDDQDETDSLISDEEDSQGEDESDEMDDEDESSVDEQEDLGEGMDEDELGIQCRKDRAKQKRKRMRRAEGMHERMERRRQRMTRMRRYGRHTWIGSHSSGVVFEMAEELHKTDSVMLWLAIVGLTDCFLHGFLPRMDYNTSVSDYATKATKLSSSSTSGTGSNVNGESITISKHGSWTVDASDEKVESSRVQSTHKIGHIAFSQEMNLTLLRFWSLYDSLYYSPRIATALSVWKESGQGSLRYLLAKMSVPLSEAKQPYSSMSREIKEQLPELLEKYGSESPELQSVLSGLRFGNFTRQHGAHLSLSAADMVHCLDALVEYGRGGSSRVSRFWMAYDLLLSDFSDTDCSYLRLSSSYSTSSSSSSGSSSSLSSISLGGRSSNKESMRSVLKWAISLAKERWKGIVELGARVCEKHLVRSWDFLRLCELEQRVSERMLVDLVEFTAECRRVEWKRRHPRKGEYNEMPLIMAAIKNDEWLRVMGLVPRNQVSQLTAPTKSPFQRAFREASETIHARCSFLSFNANSVEILKRDFDQWVQQVQERIYTFSIED